MHSTCGEARPAEDVPAEPRGESGALVKRPDGSAEVIVFPGLDVEKVAAALEFWKRTGKPYKGAPD